MTSTPESLTRAARNTLEMLAKKKAESTQVTRIWADEALQDLAKDAAAGNASGVVHYQHGRSLLHVLIKLKDTAGLERALELGAHASSPTLYGGKTPLHEAAEDNNVECMALLLRFGADLEERNNGGETALHCASEHMEASAWLLDHGADLEAKDKKGKTPVFHAALGHWSTLDLFLRRGADVSVVDQAGDTVLAQAIHSEDLSCVLRVLEHGCDVNQRDGGQWTPLQLAINRTNRQAFDALLAYGASVAHDPSDPLFHMLVDYDRLDWAGALLKAGADPHCVNRDQKTVQEYIHEKADSSVLSAQWRQWTMEHGLPPARRPGPSARF